MNEENKLPKNWKIVTSENISEGKNAIVVGNLAQFKNI